MLNHEGLAKNQLGKVLSQSHYEQKPNLNWRRFTSNNERYKKHQINLR